MSSALAAVALGAGAGANPFPVTRYTTSAATNAPASWLTT
jgi:hypothetical protein